jgi:hypothetical protein
MTASGVSSHARLPERSAVPTVQPCGSRALLGEAAPAGLQRCRCTLTSHGAIA